MMRWWIVLGAAVAAVVVFLVAGRSRVPGEILALKEPRIVRLPARTMLVLATAGDPNAEAGPAYRKLFAAFYRLPGQKAMRPPAPLSRWPRLDPGAVKGSWTGVYAMPVPGEVTAPPAGADPGVKVERWEAGDYAEILHAGPYSAEADTIGRLRAFIGASRRKAVDGHEEEYVRGPGRVFRGNPNDYLTIIRLKLK